MLTDMEENNEQWVEPSFYRAKVSIKLKPYKAGLFTIVCVSSSSTSAKVEKSLLKELTRRYADAGLEAEVIIKELKKISHELFVWLD